MVSVIVVSHFHLLMQIMNHHCIILGNGNRCESGVKNKNYYVEWIYNLKLKNFAILLGDDHVSGQRNTRDQKFIIVRRHILSFASLRTIILIYLVHTKTI